MMVRGIKSSIIFNTALLLLIGMVLVYFATTITSERQMINSISRSGFRMIEHLPSCTDLSRGDDAHRSEDCQVKFLRQTLPGTLFEGVLLHGQNGSLFVDNHSRWSGLDHHKKSIQKRIKTGIRETWTFASIWAVFWKQSRFLVISCPIKNGTRYTQAALVFDLNNIYDIFRWSQKGILIYILINTFILTAVGFYRLYRIYLRPLNRLVVRAEEYNDSGDTLFSVRKEDNELQSLSRALNRLVARITKDKKDLGQAVVALERANRELKNAQQEVIRAEKLASIGRLSSGIAHEIGNPIGIVMGYLDLLKNPELSDTDRNDFIERTGNEIDRINRIIRQLLDMSKPIQEGEKQVGVHEIIQDLQAVVKVQPFMADIDLVLTLSAERDIIIADAGQLRQVFLNILINAVDAMTTEADKKVGIVSIVTENFETDDATHWMRIVFEDNGSGIDSDAINNIFDPFFTTKDPGKGTGLGLSVCYMIVEQMGGKLEVNSQPGEGTSMSMMMPLIAQHQNESDL